MKKVPVSIVQSFVKDGLGGNAAGVVTNAEGLSAEQMQEISKKVGHSETAFVLPSKSADYKLRFFTPNAEVDLCGHATVATFSLLRALEIMKPGTYTQETRAGLLGIRVSEDGTIYYEQKPPVFSENIPVADIAEALRVPEAWIDATGLKPQVVSTGMRDMIVAVDLRRHVDSVNPDFEKIISLSKTYNVIGMHVCTLETIDPLATAYCRNFAPLYEINEEAATGSSNGALACYLFHNKKIPLAEAQNLIFEQGYSMKSPSEIRVSLKPQNDLVTEVWVGGRAIKKHDVMIDLQ